MQSESYKLSPKQEEFLLKSTAKVNIAYGAVRGGKTHASLLRFIELALRCPDDEIIMIGNSFSTIEANAVRPIVDVLWRGYSTWQKGNNTLLLGNKRIRVIGANDEGAVRAIQGNTHSLSYVDELTTIPQNFLDMLLTRLSKPHSTMVATCNPDSPVHPVKTQLIDCPDKSYCYSLHFDIDDNPILDDRAKSDLRTKFSGLFHKRYILGQWVAAEGAIYADFDRKTHVVSRVPPGGVERYYMGIDYGMNNAFAAVIVGHRSDHTPRLWVEKELYWNPAKTFRQKTNSEYADDIERFSDGYPITSIFLDPSALSFKVELARRGIRTGETLNEVFPGITFISNIISNHQLVVLDSCPNLIGEMERYVWDSKKSARGIEEPVKKDDHLCDAMRYAIYSSFGKTGRLDKKSMGPEDGRTLGWKPR